MAKELINGNYDTAFYRWRVERHNRRTLSSRHIWICKREEEKEVIVIEQIRCDCHFKNVIAERDVHGIYIQCRGCKEKKRIDTSNEPDFWQKLGETLGIAVRDYLSEHFDELSDNLK